MKIGSAYRTFPDVKGLCAYLLCEIERTGLQHVSFDVFDTLVHRRAHPDAIIWGVCKWLEKKLSTHGITQGIDCLASRHRTYVRLTQAKVAGGLDEDVALDELVLPWVRECAGRAFDGDEELARLLAETESDYEIASCICNEDFLALAKELKRRGIRLVFSSDMYLGRKYVQRILDACGYENLFDAGYVSADYSLLKRTGRLFDALLTQEGLAGRNLFHIGDNELSDGVQPSERGIRALVHKESRLLHRYRQMEYDYKRVRNDDSWFGVLAAQFAEADFVEMGTPEAAYGRRVLGPIFTAFIHGVLERCRKEKISRVYFFAREGHTLKILFDQLAPIVFRDADHVPKSVYLCVSRLTTFWAAMQDFSLRELTASLHNVQHCTVRNLLAPLQIDSALLATIGEDHGFHDLDALLPSFFWQWPPFFRLLEDRRLRAILRTRSAEMKGQLLTYLEQLGFFDLPRVAVVDIGWSGQIQDNLYTAVHERPECPQIFGFYLGTTVAAHWRKTPKNWMESVLVDQEAHGWSGKSAFEFVLGLEAVIRAPHGTVIGYECVTDKISPSFKSDDDAARRVELADDPKLALFQQGIRTYGQFYAQAIRIFDFSATSTMPYARMMLGRMVRFPGQEEVQWVSRISNVSDLGSSEINRLGASENAPFWQVRRLRHVLRQSRWSYGVVAAKNNAFFQWIFVVYAGVRTASGRHCHKDVGTFKYHSAASPLRCDHLDNSDGVVDEEVTLQVEKSHFSQVTIGETQSRLVKLNPYTSPLTTWEALSNGTAFYVVRGLCFFARRRVPIQDGMSVRGWLARSLYRRSVSECCFSIRKGSANLLRRLFGSVFRTN